MKIKKYSGIAIVIALLAITVVRLYKNKQTSNEKVYAYDKEKPISVEADTLKIQVKTAFTRSFSGTFEPNRESRVSAEVQGKISSVLVEPGSLVYKGQALVQLDNSLLQLQRQATEIQIGGLQADVDRYTVLARADAVQGIQLEKAELGLKAAKIQLATLNEQISKTTIRAPFQGIVTAKLTEAGAFAMPGAPLVQITDISKMKFTVQIPEMDLKLFDRGEVFTISASAMPGLVLAGRVVHSGSKANAGNSFPVELEVPNTAGKDIKSGMFGKVQLVDSLKTGFTLPTPAIVERGDNSFVYLIKEGKAVLHPILVKEIRGNTAIVTEGIKKNDVVITGGFINLFDGAYVKVK